MKRRGEEREAEEGVPTGVGDCFIPVLSVLANSRSAN